MSHKKMIPEKDSASQSYIEMTYHMLYNYVTTYENSSSISLFPLVVIYYLDSLKVPEKEF